MRTVHLSGPLAIALAFFAALAQAQSYPAKSIRMIVGFPPGGTTDVIGRLVAAKLSERLGQQVVVENRPGASGMIGADAVAKASPDGYTLLMSSSTHATFTSLYHKIPFDPVKDFEPVSFIGTTPYVMVVHPSLPVKSVADLLGLAKARPGQLNYAASTPGTAQHLAWELFKRSTGTDLTYIAYKGTGALMPDLLSGRLQAAIDNVAVMTQHVKNGALRGIAVTSPKRSPLLPDLPTIAESGVPGFQAIGWFGVFAPAGTPEPVVKVLTEKIAGVLKQPDVLERMSELGAEAASGGQDDLRKLLANEMAVWGKVIRDSGVKIDQ
ncbi:MAG: tripartite tricarboxylate transporter substrate binding protein [Proteobacteria bacterium]|nr:tripartite tricarboxylate transporter substrate binding protein [Pseudomonadota bacterium]